MLRRSLYRAQALADDGGRNVIGKIEGYHLIGRTKTGLGTITKYRDRVKVDGEELAARGIKLKKSALELQGAMKNMENPMIWVWYPWRRTPDPPLPSFPCPNALKNLNGAVLTELSPKQQEQRSAMMYANPAESPHAAKMEARHPFLKQILQETAGRRTGFPFFFKKYPTTRHALDARFAIPTEMVEGLPADLQRALSPQQMTVKERQKRQINVYAQRYAEHELDEQSPAVRCVRLAINIRELRNHLMSNPNNNVIKTVCANKEIALRNTLRRLRKINFRRYWEILRDHDMMEVMQPTNAVSYKWGAYWRYDWEKGNAIATNIADFMDPRGLNGCIETGRSRAEVARDLGLSYTRPLNDNEKKVLSQNMLYWTKLQQFKIESPEAHKRRERLRFISKFTSLHQRTSEKTSSWDFPSHYRRLLGTKILRWKSKRHGPE